MGGLIDIERARALVSDRMLWPRVRDFLWDFTPQVHPSWLESLPGCAMSDASDAKGMALVPSLMSSPRTKRFILSSLGVEPCFHAFPKEDWQGILFSSKDEAGEYIVKEPRINGSDLVANMSRDGQACEVRMAAYPAACAELARSIVEELRAREIRREEAKMEEFRSAWRKEQIGKAEDRKIEKEL